MPRWKPEELEKLKEEASKCQSWEELYKKFPDRKPNTIKDKCERAKIKLAGQRIQWTEEELELLKNEYPFCEKVENLLQLFPSRTVNSIVRQANRLGLVVESWTEEELEILRNNFADKTNEEMQVLLPRKSYRAITTKAHKLGLKKTSELRSEMQTGKNNHFWGHKHNEETKEKLCEIWKKRKQDPNWKHCWLGKKHKDETKEKMSKVWKEYYKNNDGHFKGRKHTEEVRKKMCKPHHMTPEGSEKLALAVMNRNPYKKLEYKKLDGTVVYFDSSYEVLVAEGFDKFGIDWERNTKFKIRYIDDEEKIRYFFQILGF